MSEIDYRGCAEKFITYFQKTGCILDDTAKIKITGIDPDERSLTMELTVSDLCRNPGGTMHGGVIAWLADTAMGTVVDVFEGEAYGNTIDLNTEFLRPVPIGAKVSVRAYAVNLGGFIRRARAEFFSDGALVASAASNYTGKKMLGDFRIGYIDAETTRIEDGFVRVFILEGNKKALVVDSGVSGRKGLRSVAEKYSGLPAELINTHADPDHIACNNEFDFFMMHEDDLSLYQRNAEKTVPVHFVKDGDIIDLGGRPLEIIHVPGHTKGSIAILDINARTLYAGDTVQNSDSYMFGDFRNMDSFIESLRKLDSMKDRFDRIFSSHGDLCLPPSVIREIIDAAVLIRSGKAEGEERTVYGTPVTAYNMGCTTFLCDRKNQRSH